MKAAVSFSIDTEVLNSFIRVFPRSGNRSEFVEKKMRDYIYAKADEDLPPVEVSLMKCTACDAEPIHPKVVCGELQGVCPNCGNRTWSVGK